MPLQWAIAMGHCNGPLQWAIAMEPLHRRISTASGNERGSINRPIGGTTLATARGTDSAPCYGENNEKRHDLNADNLFCGHHLSFKLFSGPGQGVGRKQRSGGGLAMSAATTHDRDGVEYYRASRRRGRRATHLARPQSGRLHRDAH